MPVTARRPSTRSPKHSAAAPTASTARHPPQPSSHRSRGAAPHRKRAGDHSSPLPLITLSKLTDTLRPTTHT